MGQSAGIANLQRGVLPLQGRGVRPKSSDSGRRAEGPLQRKVQQGQYRVRWLDSSPRFYDEWVHKVGDLLVSCVQGTGAWADAGGNAVDRSVGVH